MTRFTAILLVAFAATVGIAAAIYPHAALAFPTVFGVDIYDQSTVGAYSFLSVVSVPIGLVAFGVTVAIGEFLVWWVVGDPELFPENRET
ncbi:hypothetical protein [Rosistilla oblonga]|uniref:hypothetical protein n=1 Tax=Rosistilla oblonga TaxID=2527990 RepID=UPI003A97DAB6